MVLVGMFVGACASARPATIRGAELYARVGELRETGRAVVGTQPAIEVKREHFLIDRSRDQVFAVEQVIENCRGTGIDDDPDCTLALLRDQRFAISASAPHRPDRKEPREFETLTRIRLTTLVVAAPLAYGTWRCDAFAGCREIMGAALIADLFVMLISYTGLK